MIAKKNPCSNRSIGLNSLPWSIIAIIGSSLLTNLMVLTAKNAANKVKVRHEKMIPTELEDHPLPRKVNCTVSPNMSMS